MILFLLDVPLPPKSNDDPLVIITLAAIVMVFVAVVVIATGVFVFIRVRRSRAATRAISEGWATTQSSSPVELETKSRAS